jgi:carbonic anhydrase
VQDVAARHAGELQAIASEDDRHRRLCELNVAEQVRNIGECTAVQDAWGRAQPLEVHGWIYDLKDGLLRDLECTRKGTS